ncbi:peptidase [Escherichia coli]|nr:peptidase [Escherichia coli]OJS19466.1 peptidase [Escherichia coli]
MIPVFDGHNDALLRWALPGRTDGTSFFERSDKGHIDLPRAVEGGFAGGFFAIFIPSPSGRGHKKPPRFTDFVTEDGYAAPLPAPLKADYALNTALTVSAGLFRIERESGGKFKVVRTADELEACLKNGVMAAIYHFEGAEMIDANLNNLEMFYQAGLRSIGPVWSRPNIFAEGVPFQFPKSPDTGPGLTDAGKALVKACNQLGIMIDLSHMNEKGFWDIAALSDAPLVATHSNVHALCRSTRNLTDKQLDAIKESDGMVGLNFAVSFLREDSHNEPNTSLETMVKHIDYLVKRIGIERVGLGSDFDGATIPTAIKDVAGLPKLIEALRGAGYDEKSLKKIAHENWLRVLRKTWKM